MEHEFFKVKSMNEFDCFEASELKIYIFLGFIISENLNKKSNQTRPNRSEKFIEADC